MIRTTVTQSFENYADEAIDKVVATCEGKPMYGSDGTTVVGTITKGRRVGNKSVEFAIEMEVI